MPRQSHGDSFRHTGTNQIPQGGSSEVVEQPPRNASFSAHSSPCSFVITNREKLSPVKYVLTHAELLDLMDKDRLTWQGIKELHRELGGK